MIQPGVGPELYFETSYMYSEHAKHSLGILYEFCPDCNPYRIISLRFPE